MKIRIASTLTVCVLLLVGCEADKEPLPKPKPAPTPHPAQAAKATAVRLYPALGEKDSTFNVAFREIYEDRLKRNARSLQDVDWPIDVANEAGRMLGVSAQFDTPPPPPPPEKPEREPNALERPAYNQRRAVHPPAPPPYTYDSQGRRIYR